MNIAVDQSSSLFVHSHASEAISGAGTRAAQFLGRVKRRFFRTPIHVEATIHPLIMNAPVDCVIHDISDAGAKLQVSHAAVPVGSLFDLNIPDWGERRRCYLVWRNLDVLGVEFVSRW